jgi:hypothetical protein
VFFLKILSAELDRLPEIPITVSLFRRACRESRRTARHHSGHRCSPRAAPAPLSATLPGIQGLSRSRRPAGLAITADPGIARRRVSARNPESPAKIFSSFSSKFLS